MTVGCGPGGESDTPGQEVHNICTGGNYYPQAVGTVRPPRYEDLLHSAERFDAYALGTRAPPVSDAGIKQSGSSVLESPPQSSSSCPGSVMSGGRILILSGVDSPSVTSFLSEVSAWRGSLLSILCLCLYKELRVAPSISLPPILCAFHSPR